MSEVKIGATDETAKQAIDREDVRIDPTIIEKSGTVDRAKTRRDQGSTHATRHGLLSRDIVRALVRSGESIRTVRCHEKKFRIFFRVEGTLGEHFFDQWWSFHLRLVLSGKLGAHALAAETSN